MKSDCYLQGVELSDQLVVAVATTGDLCRKAGDLHQLRATSTIALGRLLTSAVLTGLAQKRPGITSLQIVCKGRLQQIFAEVTDQGFLRGYVKNAELALPQMTEGGPLRRRSVALGVGEGMLAVTREPQDEHFTQSTTHLASGEIDTDVEHFLNTSDQIPTVLACDVLLDAKDRIQHAGGCMVQAMPDANLEQLKNYKKLLEHGGFASILEDCGSNATAILKAVAGKAEKIQPPVSLEFKCRCSYQRVEAALQMLDESDLADMVDKKETASVCCEFCGKTYSVAPEKIEELYKKAARAKG